MYLSASSESMAGLAVSLLPMSRRILSLRREIESLSANSGFSLHLVGFAAVAEREETVTSGRDEEFRVILEKEERLREKSLRGGGKEQSLKKRGVVIRSGFGSKDVIFNKNPRGLERQGDNEKREMLGKAKCGLQQFTGAAFKHTFKGFAK